ncbi:hypothetical protein Vafri_1212, partial [Volvox africanus]
ANSAMSAPMLPQLILLLRWLSPSACTASSTRRQACTTRARCTGNMTRHDRLVAVASHSNDFRPHCESLVKGSVAAILSAATAPVMPAARVLPGLANGSATAIGPVARSCSVFSEANWTSCITRTGDPSAIRAATVRRARRQIHERWFSPIGGTRRLRRPPQIQLSPATSSSSMSCSDATAFAFAFAATAAAAVATAARISAVAAVSCSAVLLHWSAAAAADRPDACAAAIRRSTAAASMLLPSWSPSTPSFRNRTRAFSSSTCKRSSGSAASLERRSTRSPAAST